MDCDAAKLAVERRRKIIDNAEARLKRISDLAKSQSRQSPEGEFVDFEVDSFVNQPSKNVTLSASCSEFTNNDAVDSKASCGECGTNEVTANCSARNSDACFSNGGLSKSRLGVSNDELEADSLNGLSNLHGNSNNVGFPHSHSFPLMNNARGQSLSNGYSMNQMNLDELNESMNAMSSLFGVNVQNQDVGNLLNAFSTLTSAAGQNPTAQAANVQETPPLIKPQLCMLVFVILGVLARLFLQFTTLRFNIFTPFLGLAIPLAVMSWGRGQIPLSGLWSTVFLFIRNPRTQTLIVRWVRLMTLLKGISRLFAFYLFSIVITHIVLELCYISSDVDQHSSAVN